ncbi:hypothetical protein O159_08090 [Leifsonia xyli subsp. cynodontis DSM 46306]|uniref:DUF1622 domain-containing protein n=1 Tax=Leifsonia xyli subsp. cynodontis DSM 46306 TaxID=1389489 RepID=U3P684_LEIXC|nr:DUF1622 domain-containing protein [Leifsonia xyli]AGW40964.1 hypothetical protein O159_08090 [Leifsonia xyli subsp. cynodontis DSM 46306]
MRTPSSRRSAPPSRWPASLALAIGFLLALAAAAWRRTGSGAAAIRTLRESFGGVILLGLEILVAADLVKTVASDPTLTDAFVLGVIVLIRTILSFSLQVEIEGVAPWRRAFVTGPEMLARAARRAGEPQPERPGPAASGA